MKITKSKAEIVKALQGIETWLINTKKTAEVFGVSAAAVRRSVGSKGGLPAFQVMPKGHLFFDPKRLEKWVLNV
jgi:hypothetical protein